MKKILIAMLMLIGSDHVQHDIMCQRNKNGIWQEWHLVKIHSNMEELLKK